jgi:hypothetical protein
MTQTRNSEQDTNARRLKARGASGSKGGAAAVAGRSAYRQDYERDYGPDLDEWLDATEFPREA